MELGIYGAEKEPWILKFDGSSTKNLCSVGIMIISLRGLKRLLYFNLAFECTNNQIKYETWVIGLEILLDIRAKMFEYLEILNWHFNN